MMTKPAQDVVTLGDLVDALGGELLGPRSLTVRQVATLEAAGPDELSFLTGSRYRAQLATTRAAAVVLGHADREATDRPRIVIDNPYLYFARVSARLNPEHWPGAGVHASAAVHPDARVAATATVCANAVVEAGASIADRAVVGPGCVIGERASVGMMSRLHANVTVYHDCHLGDRCIIHAGVVIGADGFGMAEDQGRWVKVPQIGRVMIGDDVEIGANTTVDRGALGDTVIEEGVKLDNQIQIGHNVVIGAHTAVAACAGFAGSTRVGRHCRIGGAAMIHGHIEICDGVVVAAGTMIRRSITQPGLYDGFFPALPHKEWVKNLARFNRLDELAHQVQGLAAGLQAIKNKEDEAQ
jgi:UDP-3-O-[3-hydroxymyristoyl] glucosamine N-acyltransferase